MHRQNYKQLLSGAAGLCAVLLAGMSATPAQADTGSIATRDVGGGQLEVTVAATAAGCADYGSCNWFSFVVERHPAIPCADDSGFVRNVSPVHTELGTETSSFIFTPFFPRQTKLCLIVVSVAHEGPGLVAESTVDLPVGYGQQRSTAKTCSDFRNAAEAQYYLYLYPDDPSGLDPGHVGRACVATPCPCEALRIPAEPLPPPAPVPVVTPSAACVGAQGIQRRARLALDASKRRQASRRVVASRRASLRRAQRRVRYSCSR